MANLKNKFANIFIPPTRNIEGHGENMDETDRLYSFDAETEDYLKGIINEFSMAALYTDEFTSKDLIYFLEIESRGNVEYAESHAYNANDALEDALGTIEKDFICDVYFLIYIGSNFEAKENLIDSAKRIIRKALREEISEDDMPDFKVAIAQDRMLMGGADLRLYAFD